MFHLTIVTIYLSISLTALTALTALKNSVNNARLGSEFTQVCRRSEICEINFHVLYGIILYDTLPGTVRMNSSYSSFPIF